MGYGSALGQLELIVVVAAIFADSVLSNFGLAPIDV
jgi:hypothetical protein